LADMASGLHKGQHRNKFSPNVLFFGASSATNNMTVPMHQLLRKFSSANDTFTIYCNTYDIRIPLP
jgi:hypothetical protein